MLSSAVLMLGWTLTVMTTAGSEEIESVVSLLELVLEVDEGTAVQCIEKLSQKAQNGELSGEQLGLLRQRLAPSLQAVLAGDAKPLQDAALILAASWNDPSALDRLRQIAWDTRQPEPRRIAALDALAARHDPSLLEQAPQSLLTSATAPNFQRRVMQSLSRLETVQVADLVLRIYSQLSPDLQPQAIGLLTQRPAWSKQLLTAIRRHDLSPSILNVNHLRGFLTSRDEELVKMAQQQFGSVRTERNPQREQVIAEMRDLLANISGDARRGHTVFHKVCGQCHRIHGVGQEVGPDITSNGRASYDQLLSNVFDPSLVIGPAYQAVTVVTQDGRVLTGLVAEDSEQRIALKVQGGKQEIVPRDEIDEVVPSKLSLMPEGLEKQLMPQELADLFAFLVLDRPPEDPAAQAIPGTPTK